MSSISIKLINTENKNMFPLTKKELLSWESSKVSYIFEKEFDHKDEITEK